MDSTSGRKQSHQMRNDDDDLIVIEVGNNSQSVPRPKRKYTRRQPQIKKTTTCQIVQSGQNTLIVPVSSLSSNIVSNQSSDSTNEDFNENITTNDAVENVQSTEQHQQQKVFSIFSKTSVTTLKYHLESCDKDGFAQVISVDSANFSISSKSNNNKDMTKTNQPKLDFTDKYSYSNQKQVQFMKALTWLIGSNPLPNSLVENKDFRKLIETCNRKLKVPYRPTMMNHIKLLHENIQQKITELLKPVRRMTLSGDIWTKRGMKSSFLGVNATFYHPVHDKKMTITLAVRKIQSVTHTAKDILREMKHVVSKYNIEPNQVFRGMTDSGSNMIASFRECLEFFDNTIEKGLIVENTHLNVQNSESVSSTTTKKSTINVNNNNSITSSSQVLIEEAETLEDFESRIQVIELVSHLEAEEPFEFVGFCEYKRLPCFIHKMLTCIKVFEEDDQVKGIIDKLRKVVSKFTTSWVLTGTLYKKCNLRLIGFSATRWNVVYMVIDRILKVKDAFIETLISEKKDKYLFSTNEWSQILEIKNFLQPFYEATVECEYEKDKSPGEFIVLLKTLLKHLVKMNADSFLFEVSQNISKTIKLKFGPFMENNNYYSEDEEDNSEFDATFLVCTLLDPRYKFVLSKIQIDLAVDFFIEQHGDNRFDVNLNEQNAKEMESQSPPSKMTKIQSLLVEMRQEQKITTTSKSSGSKTLAQQLKAYISDPRSDIELKRDEKFDIFHFWKSLYIDYPSLIDLALDYTAIPLSIADVERVFSYGGISTCGRRNKLDEDNLEQEIMLSRNKKLAKELFNI